MMSGLQETKIKFIKYFGLSYFQIFSIRLFFVKLGQFKKNNCLCKSNKDKYYFHCLVLALKIRINFVFIKLGGSLDIVSMFYDILKNSF